MGDNFHSDLAVYVKNNDNENATRVILNELAKALVKDRENFIEVLRSADVSVFDSATDLQLIDAFIKNAPTNKKMLIGASFLINHRNQQTNFDGESEISDIGVKNSYKAMDDFFNAEGYSNAGWSDAIKSIADVGGQVSGGIMKGQDAKKRGASSQLAQQTSARKELIQNTIAQRQKEAEQKTQEGGKTKRTLLIVGGVSLALIIGIGIYFAVRKKK